uniref:Early E3 18.5 kDa glycoprotein n=1 Tax=Human mastadenovirus C TaxID=129951 RepID=A0A7L4WGU4_9ADEN|nr:membrane glycoprotein E3 gp19K [Human mastadenovirus C]QVX26564.1 E3 gp19K [Human mastadenovirus C]WHN38650.1 E3 gp19K [Human mastadenovirus C]
MRYIILGLFALAAVCNAAKKVEFKEPACNVTFKSEANECTTLIKCTTEHEKLIIRHKDKIGKYAVYAIWQPGDTNDYNVTVFQGENHKTFMYKFPFYEMCDITMYMSKQYKLWPPQKCLENTGTFCSTALLITALALVCTLLYLKYKSRRSFIDEKKMP